MDAVLLSIKAAEQRLMDYLLIYKRCRTADERAEIQQLIFACEQYIANLRACAAPKPTE